MANNDTSSEGIVIQNFCSSKEARDKYLHRTTKSDFVFAGHDKIFNIIVQKHQTNERITRETLTAALPDDMTTRIMVSVAFDSQTPELTDEIFQQFKESGARNRISELKKYIDRHEKRGTPPAEIADAVRGMLDRVDEGESDLQYAFDMEQTADSAMTMLAGWRAGENPYRVHIPELDDWLFLSQLTGYTVIGGESGGGKTAMMMHIAKMNSKIGRLKTAVASLEMSKEMLCYRMAMESPRLTGKRLTQENLKNPKFFDDVKFAIDYCRKYNIVIIEGVSNIFAIKRIVQTLAVKRDVVAAILDYLQMADTDAKDSDVTRVSTISKTWKSLTIGDRKRGIPPVASIALSQYADNPNQQRNGNGNNPRPQRQEPKKMRWSRQIKMDADLLIHLQEVEPPDDEKLGEHDMYLEILCEKQRNGAAGWRVPTVFHKNLQTFSSTLLDKQRKASGMYGARDIPPMSPKMKL